MNTSLMRVAPVLCATGVLLAACGGGGGSSETAGFDAANYQSVAEPMAATVLSTGGVTATLGNMTGGELPLEIGHTPQPDPVALLKQLMAQRTREQAQQVEPFSEVCAGGGTLSGTANDADNNGDLSTGDSATITANNCVIEGVKLNGGLSIGVSRYTASSTSESGALTLSFSNFSAADAVLNGNATVSFDGNSTQAHVSVGFSNATVTSSGQAVTLNCTASVTVSGSTSSLSLAGGVGMNGHTYTLSQPVPFSATTAGLQSGGTLQIQEAVGARVKLVAGTDRFTYQYFAPTNSGTQPDSSRSGLQY
jgi:hypothetical protein